MIQPSSERELHLEAQAAVRHVRVIAVGEAPDVVHTDELEDVVEAAAELHVGAAAHEVGVRGEGVEAGVVGLPGVVLFGERAVPAAEGEDFAQL